jgi:hypothetical protein
MAVSVVATGVVVGSVSRVSTAYAESVQATGDQALTVSGVDIVGYPFVDLILGGVPGLGIGTPPRVHVTQDGQTVPATRGWLLSSGHALAVVVDAPPATRPAAQGLAAELVQEFPAEVPLFLSPARSGQASRPSVDRDLFMSQLQTVPPGSTTTVPDGIKAATAAGVQHILVITTCRGSAPAAPPSGVVVDVIGVGPNCTAGWRALGHSGSFAGSADFIGALGGLDQMVARWRSSVVVVAQAINGHPLALKVGDRQISTSLFAASTRATLPATSAPVKAAGPTSTGPATSDQDSVVAWVVGAMLLALVLLLGLLLVSRRRARRAGSATARTATARTEPAASARTEPAMSAMSIDFAQPAKPVRPSGRAATWPQDPDRIIDLRESVFGPLVVDEPEVEEPEPQFEQATRMAVATPGLVGEAEPFQPAVPAGPDIAEEPVPVPDIQTPDDIFAHQMRAEQDARDAEAKAAEEAKAAAAAQAAEEARVAAEAKAAEEAQAAEEARIVEEAAAAAAAEAKATADAIAAEDAAYAASAPPAMPATEFSWTPLTFAPLEWRYDAEPKPADEIDLRETADATQGKAVDVRDERARQPRRKKAKR